LGRTTCIWPLRDQDTDAIVAVYERASTVEAELGPVPRAAWEHFVRLPQNKSGRDFRVAEQDGHLVGLAESSLRDQGGRKVRFFKIVVDPAARRRGIAAALLAELVAIDAPGDGPSLQSLCSPSWHAGLAFLHALGFAHIESEITFRCSRLMAPSTTTPPGTSVYRVEKPEREAADLARIHNAAYRSDVAFRHYSPEEMMRALESGDVWVAADGGHLVGFCQLEHESEMVWLESIAIDPTHQGRGLGSRLAHRALQAADVAPSRPAELNVSSVNRVAIKVYSRLGFEPRRERRRYAAPHDQLVAWLALRRPQPKWPGNAPSPAHSP
jgi:ribosomal protein S18 acetylase RimI-like enzyme